MDLTHKQRKRLKRSLLELPLSTVARNIKVTEEELKTYVKKNWPQDYDRLVTKTPSVVEKILPNNFSIRLFFKENRFQFLFLFALVLVAYVNSLGNQFLSDDIGAIVDNREIGEFSFAFKHFISMPRVLMYVIIYKIFGLNPLPFRLLNIFFHLGSVFTTFVLVSYLSKRNIGVLTAALFAVHPILVESVTWISGGPYPQYTFFLLLSMFFYIYSRNNIGRYILSLIFGLLGFFTSEKAIMYPGILILLSLSYSSLKKDWKKLIPFVGMGIFFIGYSLKNIQGRIEVLTTKNYTNAGFQNPLVNLPVAVSNYLELIFWPDMLTFYHSELTFGYARYAYFVIVTLLYFGLVAYYFFKNKHLFFWLSFFFVVISPTITPYGISWVVAERYAYMATIGIFFVVAYFFNKFITNKKYETIGYVVFSLILVGLTGRTIVRNLDWRTMDHLSIATARTSPSDPKTHNNMGDVYAKRGDFQKAAYEFELATKLNPRYGDAYHNLANTYKDMQQYDLAIANYEKALEINPTIWQSYQGIAVVYYLKKDINKAVEYMLKALEIDPENPDVRTNLGIMYLDVGEKDLALEQFNLAVKLNPNNEKARLGIQEASK